MSSQPPVACTLKINGTEHKATISPYICKWGFWLQSESSSFRRRLKLAPSSAALCGLLAEHGGRAFSVDLNGYLGHVDENWGYQAADMGPYSRPLTSLQFSLAHSQSASTFRFFGTVGPVDAKTVYQGTPQNNHLCEYQIELEFKIQDQDIHLYFVETEALQAIKAYVQTSGALLRDT